MQCPDYVFSIPNNAPFKINDVTYKSAMINVENTLSLLPEWSQRINFHLLPNLHLLNLSEIAKQTSHEINAIKPIAKILSMTYTGESNTHIHIIYISVIFVAILVFTCCYRRKQSRVFTLKKLRALKKRKALENNSNDIPLEEMHSLETTSVEQSPSIPSRKLQKHDKFIFVATIITIMGSQCECIERDFIAISIKYHSPCNMLRANLNSTQKQINWCEEQFNESFQKPIKAFCTIGNQILLINKELYGNKKTEREAEFAWNNKRQTEESQSHYMISSIAAYLAILKEITTNIGRKWKYDELDERILDNSQFSITFPNDVLISDYKPLSCMADFKCEIIILMLRKKNDPKWCPKYGLQAAIGMDIVLTTLLIVLWVSKIVKNRKTRSSHFNVTYDRKITESLMENIPPPPPPPLITV